jgi:flagellar basal body P-ring protein FlgI
MNKNQNILSNLSRRHFILATSVGLAGCGTISSRAQSPDAPSEVDLESGSSDIYIGEVSAVWGLNDFKVEGIGLITQLDGTGSDPGPSPQRTMLLNEMQTHRVPAPNDLLAGSDTSLVIVRAYLPPAIQKGERFDVEVFTMPRSETTSLKGGFLMQARLRQMEVLGGRVQMGNVSSLAKGRVVTDSVFDDSGDEALVRRGIIYGGAVAMNSRPIGLVVRDNSSSVRTTSTIGRQINQRFHTVENGGKVGVATPKDDRVIDMVVPAIYQHNIGRYFSVVSQLIYRESSNTISRIDRLQRELLEPSLAARAALRLEAIGKDAIPALNKGVRSENIEVQFYSAEALAYLGETSVAKQLGQLALAEPAFRWRALTALSAIDDLDSAIVLSDLMHAQSAETRYGAFRAIHARSPLDPSIHTERLADADFAYHVIPSTEAPMIHFSRSRRQEVVLFGHDQRVNDNFLYVTKGLTIKADSGKLLVTRFSSSGEDRRTECSTSIDELIRNLVASGVDYGELIEVMKKAKESKAIETRLVIDAVPKANRSYKADQPASGELYVSGPVPELFSDLTGGKGVKQASFEAEYDPVNDEQQPKLSFQEKLKKVWRK